MSERSSRRRNARIGGTYRDRIPLEEDFEVVQARTASRTTFSRTAVDLGSFSVPSPWTVGSSWAPEENDDFSLDPDGEWYDEALEADVGDVMESIVFFKAKKKRSQASVR